jgi:hypothetical protein
MEYTVSGWGVAALMHGMDCRHHIGRKAIGNPCAYRDGETTTGVVVF